MSLVLLQNVNVRYDERVVLRDAYFRLAAGERVGLIGKNGAGKTTLLRLILGQVEPAQGSVTIALGTKIGYFSQFSELSGEQTVQQVLEHVFAEVRALEAALRELEDALGSSLTEEAQQELLERHAILADEFERRGGWTYQTEIDTVLSKLGFTEELRHRPVDQLSGGWRNRASLAKLLLERPDVLLLDEPTNYLDIDGVAWLENWLVKHRGAATASSRCCASPRRSCNSG